MTKVNVIAMAGVGKRFLDRDITSCAIVAS